MRTKVIIAIAVALALGAAVLFRRHAGPPAPAPADGVCSRIVSLSPGTTEVLFALGLGDKVVGVTRYCDYPPEATEKPKVGGYIGPSYEAIVALKPDLVIMAVEHEKSAKAFRDLGLNAMLAEQKTIAGILDSITLIGERCGAAERAAAMVAGLRGRMDRVRRAADGLPRPRVLATIGRNMGSQSLRDIFIVGRRNFHDEMIALAGGVNVYEGNVPYPQVDGETLFRLNPDVIVDFVPEVRGQPVKREEIIKDWRRLPEIAAVRSGRLCVVSSNHVLKPCPRFIETLESLARELHPEAKWESPTPNP